MTHKLTEEQIQSIEESVEDAVFSGKETPSKGYLIASAEAN